MTRLVLHHAQGCALSQAVRMALAEKGLERKLHTVGLATFPQMEPGFLVLNPAGQAPVLETDKLVLTEAFLILCWIDEQFPEPSLGGADPVERYRVLEIGQIVETGIAPNLALLEWVADPRATPPDAAIARLPRERRAWWTRALAGFPAAEGAAAEVGVARALETCEQRLLRRRGPGRDARPRTPALGLTSAPPRDVEKFPLLALIRGKRARSTW